MRESKYSDEKCAQILTNVKVWTQDCQKHSEYKNLSRDAKKNLYNIASFFTELMYSFHNQSPEQWTETALNNILTEIYPYKLLVQASYYKAVEPALSVFIKYLQSINVINSDRAQALDNQLKKSAVEMFQRYEKQNHNTKNKQTQKTNNKSKPKTASNETYEGAKEIQDALEALMHIDTEHFLRSKQPSRNDPCPCGSGEKYKKCCLHKTLNVTMAEKPSQSKATLSKDKHEPTHDQWGQLYEVAKNIKLLAPWTFLRETDLITIMLPWQKEPVYCSVIGGGGECFGVGIYPGYESINSFYRMLDTPEDKFNDMLGFEQTCLMCYYGDSDELSPKDREVLKALNLRFRGRNEWIYFRSMEPGYFPWYLNFEQADLLIQALQNFFAACTHLKDLEVNFDDDETLLRYYSPEKKLWVNTAVKMPPIPEVKHRLIVDDEKLFTNLKKKECNNAKLEFELMYMPIPVQENEKDRPRLPCFLLLADKIGGGAIDQHMTEDGDVERSILEMLSYYIVQFGRPLSIHVRNEHVGCYLADFCQKIGVEIVEGKGVPTVDHLLENMLSFMVKELSGQLNIDPNNSDN
ncbi:MAG: SEC-C metal-binding domain-containing protein [Candidatus Bathyarchaeota archaeon]|nr:SEC-C metal-binding domain-containing protein [Candidatus Termiticorpusculum sp.]